jgi:hypothetical protein
MTVDRDRLVEWALSAVSTPSFTGQEEAMGRLMQQTFEAMGLQTQWQQVEEGRPNVLGTWDGTGGGPTLMFNGHMTRRTRGATVARRDPRLPARGVSSGTDGSTASASRT